MAASRLSDLRLFWKLLLPFLGLIVLFGSMGAFLIVRDLTARAQDALDQDLARRSFEARSVAHDRELYLVESANFASNIQGMAAAVAAGDEQRVQTLLGSVLALKGDVNLIVATDRTGRGLTELRRASPMDRPVSGTGTAWGTNAFVAMTLGDASGQRRAGFTNDSGQTMLVIAAPICHASRGCESSAGAALVGLSIDQLVHDAAGASQLSDRTGAGAAIYDSAGGLLATSGVPAPGPPARPDEAGRLLRVRSWAQGEEIATLYVPFTVQGKTVGTLAVSVPSGAAFASVRSTGERLFIIVLLVMLGVFAVGAWLSRSIMAQLRPLVATNRALGTGDLSARAPVVSNDELGELAHGVNQMAEQLEAVYDSLELRVAERTGEIQRLLQDRTDFFASVSHDLRTPLAVIRNQALMLRSQKFGEQSPMAVAETIVASSNQLLTLINELLELAKVEAGRFELDLEAVRFKDVVKGLRPVIDGLVQEAGLKVTISVPKDVPVVLADARRLREILLNLIDNAVKYSPSGGKVTIAAVAHADHVAVSVHDTGIGIPEEERERLFEPFYRVKGNQPQRGQASTGLGLALTKRYVEAHGGVISFESAPGAGSTFVFTLPRLPDGPGGRPAPARISTRAQVDAPLDDARANTTASP